MKLFWWKVPPMDACALVDVLQLQKLKISDLIILDVPRVYCHFLIESVLERQLVKSVTTTSRLKIIILVLLVWICILKSVMIASVVSTFISSSSLTLLLWLYSILWTILSVQILFTYTLFEMLMISFALCLCLYFVLFLLNPAIILSLCKTSNYLNIKLFTYIPSSWES